MAIFQHVRKRGALYTVLVAALSAATAYAATTTTPPPPSKNVTLKAVRLQVTTPNASTTLTGTLFAIPGLGRITYTCVPYVFTSGTLNTDSGLVISFTNTANQTIDEAPLGGGYGTLGPGATMALGNGG